MLRTFETEANLDCSTGWSHVHPTPKRPDRAQSCPLPETAWQCLPDELRLAVGFALAAAAALASTPLAIAVATRTGFNDKPVGYKGHSAPTPYLGGAAVVAAFLIAGVTVGGELSRLSPIVVAAFGFWCLGTVDDKLNLDPKLRRA